MSHLAIPIFKGLNAKEISSIISMGRKIDFEPGDLVIKKDGEERSIYVLLSGVLEIRDGDLLVRQVSPGEIIGELAFLLSSERTVDVFAGGDGAQVLRLDEASLQRRIRTKMHPEALLYFNLSKSIAEKLAEVTRNLRSIQQQLVQQEKLASLGQLTAGIAHELKNPLNFVNNFAGLNKELVEELKEDLSGIEIKGGDSSVAGFEETLDLIKINTEQTEKHGKRAAAIVENMMLHANKGVGKRDYVSFNDLVADHIEIAYQAFRNRFSDTEIVVNQYLDPTLGKVLMVPQDIGRALLNILMNALDAVREKKMLEVATYEPAVTVRTKKLAGRIAITISDNGVGISKGDRKKIFEPFFTTKPPGMGTGLGLSMSYDIIVQGHGGTLILEYEEGTATTFAITLPA